ncbi:PilN domain-containing protein [Euzebya sp.]|uniref:PilN domain-containing protein n=1 Tax=Euzebya sp. TaxID=1971409 RepID=UPI0035179A32
MTINLLPDEDARRVQIRRRALYGLLVIALLWAVLGLASLLQLSGLSQVQEERDATATRVAQLQGEVDSLAVFQELADDVASGNQVLAFAMADEVSWAQLLVDLSRGIPPSASFTDIDGQLTDAPTGALPGQQDVFIETDDTDIGFFAVDGYTTELFTPGIEELLRRFGEIDGFFQEYLSSATAGEIGDVDITQFNAEVRLDDDARTGRYAEGLPEAER